jgi:hypothetical protein
MGRASVVVRTYSRAQLTGWAALAVRKLCRFGLNDPHGHAVSASACRLTEAQLVTCGCPSTLDPSAVFYALGCIGDIPNEAAGGCCGLDRVTVVIPTYNRAFTIQRAIDSALAAIAPDDEVIVVDDGSTDDTADVVRSYGDRVAFLWLTHQGAGCARNQGVAAARGELVAFLDSDDTWMPDRLHLGRQLLAARPDVLFCFSDFRTRRGDGSERGGGLYRWHRDPRSWDEILGPGIPFSTVATLPAGRPDFCVHVGDLYPQQMAASYVSVITLLVRRREAGDALRFAEDLPTYEDYECVSHLAKQGKAAYLACETACQWGHAEPRLSNADALTCATTRLRILERLFGNDPVIQSNYGARYRRLVTDLRVWRARSLLRIGSARAARDELRRSGRLVPLLLALTWVPAPVLRRLYTARDWLQMRT